ncbi:MAG: hypothetical protein JSU68_11295 [Phycisphaerales bacterium]|nr:MAG: hypothetical protein JSU68_11295 [Phycisphaerales bacterium]
MCQIKVTAGQVTITATLNDSNTARLIADALPFESSAQLWGDEIYFSAPITTGEDNPQAEVESGAVGYWPPGKALCLFFGQQPYSPVNIVGRIDGDPCVLAAVRDGDAIRVEPA